jgi:ribosomal protein S18 acetylase RimI-like enzyme
LAACSLRDNLPFTSAKPQEYPSIIWWSWQTSVLWAETIYFMFETKIYDAATKPSSAEKTEIVNFLFENLEQYGDPKQHILKCVDYALKEISSFGGFVLVAKDNEEIKGAVVVNQTGMGGYIPENILVYIATSKNSRGQGIGKLLMQKAIETAKGDIALHVEENNPAKILYEKLGFTNPYLEMRLKK